MSHSKHNLVVLDSIKSNNRNANKNDIVGNSYDNTGPMTPRVRKQSKRDKSLVSILDTINYNRVNIDNIVDIKDDPLIPLVEKIVKAADMR